MDYFIDVITIFLTLNMVVMLLPMEGQKALRYHLIYLKMNKGLTGLERHEGE